jgi:glycosyltransferase involved in cell wall biosynthesis
MRIALIASPYLPVPPPGYGGTEAVLDGLARGLAANGHDVVLYSTGDATCPVPLAWTYDEAVGVGVPGPTAEARHVVGAYDHPSVRAADVVHDHTVLGPLYGTRFAAPIVTTAHAPFVSDCGDIYRATSGRVALVAISHHQAASLDTLPVAAVIHHGIDVAAIPMGSGNGGYALFLGRMHPDKGVVHACHLARRAGLPLLIAAKMGESLEYAYFDAAVRPLLGLGVEYLGEIGATEKWRLLGDAVCLLNPIAWPEPFGMVMIESLACGTPVVTTPMGAAPEIVVDGATGIVASVPELYDRLVDVKAVDRCRCRRDAETRFSSQRMVNDHVALYERLIGERRD